MKLLYSLSECLVSLCYCINCGENATFKEGSGEIRLHLKPYPLLDKIVEHSGKSLTLKSLH